MSGLWQSQIDEAINDTRRTRRTLKSKSTSLAQFLQGNLKDVRPDVLRELKQELRNFNATTGKWKL